MTGKYPHARADRTQRKRMDGLRTCRYSKSVITPSDQPHRPPRVTRFAPSPTGYLHLGHVAAALYAWGLGRRLGARVLLRIEDHDRGRCREIYAQAILDDLAWLGFVGDNQAKPGTLPESHRQSAHPQRYQEAIEALAAQGLVYACDCSRARILQRRSGGAPEEMDELRYDGFCRTRSIADGPERGLRGRLDDEDVFFHDLLSGPQTQRPAAQCGDLLLRDRHGCFTYQLGVVADDIADGVTHVIRGEDLLPSTGRQILLARQLGHAASLAFAHHPLIVDERGVKLGKRFLSEAITKRRLAGEPAERILGEAAYAAGLLDRPMDLAAGDAPRLFDGFTLPPEAS